MSTAQSGHAVLFGRRDLDVARLATALTELVDGRELSLGWKAGCPAGEDGEIGAAYFALDRAGAWVVSRSLLPARKLAMRMSEHLAQSLEYFEARFDKGVAVVLAFECAGRRLSSKSRTETDPHDGNAILIALDGAGLLGAPLARGSEFFLYPVTSTSAAAPDDRAVQPVKALRPNLASLWQELASGTPALRRVGPNEYILEISAGSGSISTIYLDAAEVAHLEDEMERRALAPFAEPDLHRGLARELLRWVAYSGSLDRR